jgi:hypothetical protein
LILEGATATFSSSAGSLAGLFTLASSSMVPVDLIHINACHQRSLGGRAVSEARLGARCSMLNLGALAIWPEVHRALVDPIGVDCSRRNSW